MIHVKKNISNTEIHKNSISSNWKSHDPFQLCLPEDKVGLLDVLVIFPLSNTATTS